MLKFTERMQALPRRRQLALLALLTLSLFAAESLAALHQDDLKAHSSDDPCKICLSLSAFTSGNVATTQLFSSLVQSPLCEVAVPAQRPTRDVPPHQARGPPGAS